jgi:hypothetical protein
MGTSCRTGARAYREEVPLVILKAPECVILLDSDVEVDTGSRSPLMQIVNYRQVLD